jgi:hypothetical protein
MTRSPLADPLTDPLANLHWPIRLLIHWPIRSLVHLAMLHKPCPNS